MSKIDRIIQLLEEINQKLSEKPKKTKTEKVGIDVWAYYSSAFINRYKSEPTRNATVNGMLSQVRKRVPTEEVAPLMEFFFRQTDAWYLREMHHPRCLVKDCEMLLTRMKTKVVMTQDKARDFERLSSNLSTSQEYLKSKYGVKNDEL